MFHQGGRELPNINERLHGAVIKYLNTVSAFILVKQPTEHINNYNFFESSTKFILTSFVTIRPGLTVIKL